MAGILDFYGYDSGANDMVSQKQQLLDNQAKIDGVQDEKIKELEEGGGSGSTKPTLVETTYSELVSLRDNGELAPGCLYRITDYECTTNQDGTQSAGHQFDIIVQATSESTLNEEARAIKNSGDTYFNEANLDAWELKYSLDNNTDRFAWADEDGKGVIYYMKDEWNNECPYDFKNIQFQRYNITECEKSPDLVGKYSVQGINGITVDTDNPYWVYTFSVIDFNEDDTFDVSVFQRKYMNDEGGYCTTENNKISDYYMSNDDSVYIMQLPDNVFVVDTDMIDDYGGFLAYYSNTFGNECNGNTFGNDCYYNTFGNNCYSNTFGNGCGSNTFGNNCSRNTFGNNCYYNTFGNDCGSNTFGNECNGNTFGNDCYNNTFGNDCRYNTFGNGCYYNTFGNASSTQSYFRWIIFDSGNQNINLFYDGTLSSSIKCQNVHVLQGVNNSNTKKDVELEIVNQQYQIFVGLKTNGTLVMYNPLDYINT